MVQYCSCPLSPTIFCKRRSCESKVRILYLPMRSVAISKERYRQSSTLAHVAGNHVMASEDGQMALQGQFSNLVEGSRNYRAVLAIVMGRGWTVGNSEHNVFQRHVGLWRSLSLYRE